MKYRKSNRAKRVSHGCRNNGSCGHCESSRTHANRRAEPADEREQRESVRRAPPRAS